MRVALFSAVLTVSAHAQKREWGPEPPVAPYSKARLPHNYCIIPMVFPVLATCSWGNDYDVDRGKFRHTGIDIRAPKMSPIVAPFAGIIGIKRETFWIYGDNKWMMLGTHLNDDNFGRHDHRASMDLMFAPNLVPGQHVDAGQFIGYVGESGNATGPHLHFEIYAPGSGATAPRIRNPYPSLKAARRISRAVTHCFSPEDRPRRGEIRLQGCIRRIETVRDRITILLVSKQQPNGSLTSITSPHYLRLLVSKKALEGAGGWRVLCKLTQWESIACYTVASLRLDDSVVHRIVLGDERNLGALDGKETRRLASNR